MASDRLVSVLGSVSAVVAAAMLASVIGASSLQPSSNCQRKCGGVDIPYPFGISSGSPDNNCYIPGFNLTCNYIGKAIYKPFYYDVEVLGISLQKGQVRILNPISTFCYNTTDKLMHYKRWSLNLGTPYSFSDADNKFTVIGCQALAYIQDDGNSNKGQYRSGCVAMCDDPTSLTNGSCSGIGCCQTTIPKGLHYYEVSFDRNFNTSDIYTDGRRCNFAVLMDSTNFTFLPSYVTSLDFNKTNDGWAPLVVDWVVGSKTCNAARKDPNTYLCYNNSECVDSPSGRGYFCKCTKGFQGNPYLQDPELGCKDIDECSNNHPCSVNAKCINTLGGFECVCPRDYPIGTPYTPGGRCERDRGLSFKAKLSIGISLSFLIGLILFLGTEWIKHKQRIARQEHSRKLNECFEHNGGQLLIDMMKVESNIHFKLYGREEIELATNNFDKTTIIGEGGQGTVYIGQNLDPGNNPVAIKKCKGFDESRRMDFGKELLILSRINHKNIVKLLGCSLHFDVPVLVYEYVPNRTLHYLIHSQDNKDLRTLDIRLKIATMSAEALTYLHSLNHPILHGDVKSANILLSPDFSAKISDFGCSMITSAVENVQVVKGTIGYLDPEYLLKLELTDKSDVYSFGVLLLELITRKKVVSKEKECLASVFQEAQKKGKHGELLDFEIIDDQQNMDVVHQLAELAARCLIIPAEHRPTMREVAEELRLLQGIIQQRPGVPFHSDRILVLPEISVTNTSEFYYGGETSDSYILKKKDWMSMEIAR